MSRRVSLPGADELFRASIAVVEDADEAAGDDPAADQASPRSSGRVRHDEKMTVYVTADELVALESARLALRRDHGLAVDRGRLVREAIAIALAELTEHGPDSEVVRRLGTS
ncbi:MAG: hypothetical protein M3Q87_11005 [Actinomycetota bacterium]|nr:hypothetical protein [Actinomycetota bacterium]